MEKLKTKLKLEQILSEPNLVDFIHKDDVGIIYNDVKTGSEQDRDSRAKWDAQTQQVVKLASLEKTQKMTPWPGASNVKYPIMTVCILQFAARAYPEIIRNGKVVGAYVLGTDPDGMKSEKARRESEKINSQLLIESSDWSVSLDKLLHSLPLIGHVFKKIYYDPIEEKNVSELIPYTDIYINQDVESLQRASRVTHVLRKSKNTLLSWIRQGLYTISDEKKLDNPPNAVVGDDRFELLEQHRYLDLDGDGYEEPYVVTVLSDSTEILRIVSRFGPEDIKLGSAKGQKSKIQSIKPKNYFVDYICFHNPDGTYWGQGYGHYLLDQSEAINSIFNALTDAGTLSNTQTGFADRSIRLKGGQFEMAMGQIKLLDTAMLGPLRDHIHILDFKGPDPTLFNLLELLIQSAKELASINNASLGQEHVQNVASQVMASQLEQGSKVSIGVQTRLYRSLKQEFEAWYALNSVFLNLEEYAAQFNLSVEQVQNDWDPDSIEVKPVADPAMGGEAYRLQRAEALMNVAKDPVFTNDINKHEVLRSYLEELRVPNIDHLLPPPDPNNLPPEVIKLKSEIDAQQKQQEAQARDQQLKAMELQVRAELMHSEAQVNQAEMVLKLAQANSLNKDPQIQQKSHEKDAVIAGMNNQTKIEVAKIAADSKAKTSTGDSSGGAQ